MASETGSNPEDSGAEPAGIPYDAPEDDVLEQRREVTQEEGTPPAEIPDDAPLDDVLEQHQEVPVDDDDE